MRPNRSINRRRLLAAVETCEPRRLLASVSGTVFNDVDQDGVRDAGDNGVSGVTVYADKNYNGNLDGGELSAVTDANGFYRIGGIVADNTSTGVRLSGVAAGAIVAPAGGGHSARFGSDYEAAGRNFAIVAPAPGPQGTVAGRVGVDSNNNNFLGTAEPGLANVRVYVDANNNGAFDFGETSTTSNGSGGYSIAVSASQASFVRTTLAGSGYDTAAYRQVEPVANGGAHNVQPAPGTTLNGLNFAFVPSSTPVSGATVTGVVYNDVDRDGVRDAGENAVANATIYADLDYDGVKDANEPSTQSSSTGAYALTGIPVSNTSIAIRLIAGGDSVVTAPAGGFHSGRFTAATTYANRNFGVAVNRSPTTGGVQVQATFDRNGDGNVSADEGGPGDATVWADLNRNGLREGSEPLLSVIGYAPVGGSPIFGLSGLTPGSYSIALRLAGDPDLYADYKVEVIAYAGSNTGAVILIPTTSSLGGVVYNDADGDGTRDGGEAGTGGVVVFADYDFDGVRDANEPQTTTLSDGTYKLYGIRSDNVAFRVTALVGGATFTQPAAGYYQARFDRAYDLAGQGGRDFGYRAAAVVSATVGGVVFNDVDRDGVRDAGEGALAGVTVYADRNYNGARDAGEPTGVTGADGRYSLSIPVGPNSVAVRLDGVAASRVTAPAGGFYSGKYTIAYNVQNANFGVAPADAAVAGRVFRDADRDGVQDAGEGGAGGVRVFADYDADGAFDADEPSTFTAADGSYGLTTRGGRFAVRVEQLEIDYRIRSGNYGRTGFLQTTAAGAAAAQVDSANASTLTNRTLGAIGARLDGVKPRLNTVGNETDDNVRAELAGGAGSYFAWRDLDRDNVRDAGEPGSLYDGLAVMDDRHAVAHLFLVADGEPYRFAVARSDAAGTVALGHREGVGGAAAAPFVDVTPSGTAVFGRLFYDANGNGARDADEGYESGFGYLAPITSVFADYDGDGVRDADEPGGEVYASTEVYDSYLSNGAYYVLAVDPSRRFTVRAVVDDGTGRTDFPQTVAPVASVAANTYAGRYDVGVTWTGG